MRESREGFPSLELWRVDQRQVELGHEHDGQLREGRLEGTDPVGRDPADDSVRSEGGGQELAALVVAVGDQHEVAHAGISATVFPDSVKSEALYLKESMPIKSESGV